MTPTKNNARQVLIALSLLAALAIYGAFASAPVEEAFFADAISAVIATQPAHAAVEPRVIRITASKFHFSPNNITLTKGQPVKLELVSSDRVHGFMIRALKIDTDVKPEKPLDVTVTPQVAGSFKAICDHYCGLGHGNMKMTIVVK